MATGVVKYGTVLAAFSLWGILLYMIQNKTIVTRVDRKENVYFSEKTDEDITGTNKIFYVDEYNFVNGSFKLSGHYSESSKHNILFVKGISNIINQSILSEERFPKSSITRTSNDLFTRRIRVKEVSCSLLVKGDTNEIMKAKLFLENHSKKAIMPETYRQLTRNCSDLKLKRGYITHFLTEDEREFPISYSILIYKDVEQTERLLRAIYRPQNIYCIHVDSKSSDDVFNAIANIANCFDNVFIASKRFNVQWGTMTVLEAELQCLQELWNKHKTWKYFINLTGQEFPLRTNYELVQILRAYNGANDIEAVVAKSNKERWKSAGTPPHGITPIKGAVHIVASRGYIDFILHDIKAKDFLEWTRKTNIPDETFFATFNHNPKLKVPGSYKGYPETKAGNIKPYLARFKNWGDFPCKGKWVRGICVFGIEDLPLLSSRSELFANKFFLDYHHLALDCMEELHYNRTRDEYLGKLTFDADWYSQLGFVINKVE